MLVWRWRLALEVSDEGEGFSGYRGTSLRRKSAPLGPDSRSMPRVLGGGAVSYEQGTPVECAAERHPHSSPKGTDDWVKGFRV